VDDQLIAIIDDDGLVRDSVERLVRSMGFIARQFSSVADFLAYPLMYKVCCIISDVNMPDGNTSLLREGLANMGHITPIIFMTGRRDRAREAALMDAGAVHVLAKPFLQREVERCISVALQRTNSRNEPALT